MKAGSKAAHSYGRALNAQGSRGATNFREAWARSPKPQNLMFAPARHIAAELGLHVLFRPGDHPLNLTPAFGGIRGTLAL